MLALPEIRDTVRIDHIKQGYHSDRAINPTGIVPIGPDLPWLERISGASDTPEFPIAAE